MSMSKVILGDCIEVMKGFKDNQFDLAIVDPPYGIGAATKKFHNGTNGKSGNKKWKQNTWEEYPVKEWDNDVPNDNYFFELFRVSKNQIIWGGNYFNLPLKSGWIFWDKKNGNSSYSDGELAWSSFDKALRKFEWLWNGFQKQRPEERFHPTQKPIALYDFCLQYGNAEVGMKILDTHLGSGSSRIAADKAGLDFTGIEIDPEYFAASCKRYDNYKLQLNLFQ